MAVLSPHYAEQPKADRDHAEAHLARLLMAGNANLVGAKMEALWNALDLPHRIRAAGAARPGPAPVAPGWHYGRPQGSTDQPTPRHVVMAGAAPQRLMVEVVISVYSVDRFDWFGPVPLPQVQS